MYGDIKQAGDCQLKVLEFGTPIPFELLQDEDSMKRIRSMYRVNTDIPGALELVHPNKFIASKCKFLSIFLRSATCWRVPSHAINPNQRERPSVAQTENWRTQSKGILRWNKEGHHLLLHDSFVDARNCVLYFLDGQWETNADQIGTWAHKNAQS
jgi:hypothetical protein